MLDSLHMGKPSSSGLAPPLLNTDTWNSMKSLLLSINTPSAILPPLFNTGTWSSMKCLLLSINTPSAILLRATLRCQSWMEWPRTLGQHTWWFITHSFIMQHKRQLLTNDCWNYGTGHHCAQRRPLKVRSDCQNQATNFTLVLQQFHSSPCPLPGGAQL